jgi:hypothetical protein
VTAIQRWLREQGDAYRAGEDRPLAGYVTLMSIYSAGVGIAAAAARLFRRPLPSGFSVWDSAQLVLATQKVSRLIAKDPVTSPLRAPFTTYSDLSAPGELSEEVRGKGLRHSVGELLTCPMCLAQWVATAFTFGLILAPKLTRLIIGTFATIGGADFLQHAYVRLQQATE